MARKKKEPRALGTIWRVCDELWADVIQPALAELDPPHRGHRPRVDQRRALDGIVYHLRTGCQWEALPAEFGDDSSVHRTNSGGSPGACSTASGRGWPRRATTSRGVEWA